MNIIKYIKIFLIFLIVSIGLNLRYVSYNAVHPDQDELFELQGLIAAKTNNTQFKRDTFYGDHTSFPGEYIMYYLPMKIMDFSKVKIDVGVMRVEGLTRNDFWKLASVKIIVSVLGLLLFAYMCRSNLIALMIYSFNYQVVYHAFEIRPYSVLPALAIFNIFLCKHRNKNIFISILYTLLFIFTCVYHAYGILIALLPFVYYFILNKKITYRFVPAVLTGLCLWAYYASYNTFGWSPNTLQAVVDPFQYFPKEKFFENLLIALTGGSLIFYLTPLLFLRIKKFDYLFLSLLVILPLSLMILVSIKTNYWIHPRQFLWVVPYFALWFGRELNKNIKE